MIDVTNNNNNIYQIVTIAMTILENPTIIKIS
jgi:hypothetical protein